MTSPWAEFWASPPSAWAPNRRTREENEATALAVRHLAGLKAGDRVLDFGCGHALGTGLYREIGVEVVLCDQSPHYRESAGARWDADVHDLESVRAIAPVHAVSVFSVLQYLDDDDLDALLRLAAGKLHPGGLLVLGDVVPDALPFLYDLRDFLPRAWTPRRVAERVVNTARLVASGRYKALRDEIPLRTFSDRTLVPLLDARGFDASRLPNIGPNKARVTWIGRRRR